VLAVACVLSIGSMAQTSAAAPQSAPAAVPAAPAAPATPAPSAGSKELPTPADKAGYAIGLNIGRSLKRDGLDVNPDMVARGLKEGLAGATPLLTDDEAKSAMMALQQQARANQEAKAKVEGEKNKKAGDDYLAENKKKDGVKTLADGLQYRVIKQGAGPKPTAADTVECNYKGTLVDGKEFDSSYKRNQTAKFAVGGVIKGWTEILQMMPVGSKYEVVLPPELAYGAQAPPQIGSNSTLIFEIELVSIVPKEATPAPGGGAAVTKPAGGATVKATAGTATAAGTKAAVGADAAKPAPTPEQIAAAKAAQAKRAAARKAAADKAAADKAAAAAATTTATPAAK
jgi:FKBP-type peptidyl-prolyl cis-trans isomerase